VWSQYNVCGLVWMGIMLSVDWYVLWSAGTLIDIDICVWGVSSHPQT